MKQKRKRGLRKLMRGFHGGGGFLPRRHVMSNKNVVYLINLVAGQGEEVLGFVGVSLKLVWHCLCAIQQRANKHET